MIIKDQFLAYQENQIHVRELQFPEKGKNKSTLVFLHDALGSIDSWKEFPVLLCTALEMNGIIFDRIGHGKSSPIKIPRPLNYLQKEATEVLPFVLTQLKIDLPILVGCSDGASIALIYGVHKHPCKAIISISAHIKVENITIHGINNTLEILKKQKAQKKLNQLHGNKTDRLIQDWATIWLSPNFKNWNIGSSLKNINCPTIVIQGAHDEYATREQAQEIAMKIGKKTKCKFIAESGHFPHLEKPNEVIHLVKNFLKPMF